MEVFPALDIFDQKVVRLYKGDFNKTTIYSENPIKTAENFAAQGAKWVHVVDLEGAQKGAPVHLDLLKELSQLGLKVQFGGGLRTFDDVEKALTSGASRVMVGSLLFKDEIAPMVLINKFGNRIVPAIDIKKGMVATHGWGKTCSLSPSDAVRKLLGIGYKTFLITSVDRDGTLMGPDIALYDAIITQATPKPEIIAAGGIASISHILELKRSGVSGVVLGKALYEGKIKISEALEVTNQC
ncbi:1-(5-phosphoribosyl)-5-((5-phosphoribosylamino)methylideneamino) imidazole-4-carboxamide isomerase [Thermovirga lienii DSM 17291]|uniref:1-(5-phosphoribosyl)-5-[(5-phosphoribosylamino)methylideneamino] imidazole-4-carboxamide isomerase n=1 Tax=Thermovirga lienii (strain ATCC BAA-1197 / DSM 17291 / Cas60314) TaxID=580340 RepID=G7V9L4_THELD|nr:1-(5-phosphoribosyl)-5-[(5-phosphoribosylamino)methylideneamino] imidazole-4-carboxamide isomerase [Thermovirga lienii]AER66564.1 1-(5-phosphoribosyl)-5-((5-phosphoribosylamino)methylideneamino) imidazole-4-carboxamide isomerase [Thermovirga lienii DSM 17291]MDN5367969.1 phosphoribosylformimino-5-aminoimidazole carboxamide ribotide isomerase [Thermovirga sp.]